MLLIPPPKRRRKRSRQPQAPAAQALTLVAASYASDELVLILQFDRPVSVADVDIAQFQVYDGTFNLKRYLGSGTATLDDPVTVRVGLSEQSSISAGNVSLFAGGENGIVATDDGGTWSGVTDVALPYSQ